MTSLTIAELQAHLDLLVASGQAKESAHVYFGFSGHTVAYPMHEVQQKGSFGEIILFCKTP